jgi:hypothetical protein
MTRRGELPVRSFDGIFGKRSVFYVTEASSEAHEEYGVRCS